MQVIILCGGLGTRLKEETEYRPKPMVPIGGKPILWHIMQIYAHYGHREFILALGYKGAMIKEYFYHYEMMNSDFCIEFGSESKMSIYPRHDEVAGWKVTLVDTGETSLKGARLKKVERYVTGDEFLVTYGDGLADLNINSLIEFHRHNKKVATLTGISPASQFGEMKIEGNKVLRFREKPEISNHLVNGGFFVFNKCIFERLKTDEACDLEIGVLDQLAEQGELMVFRHEGRWACMDTLRDTEYLNRLWDENIPFWRIWQ